MRRLVVPLLALAASACSPAQLAHGGAVAFNVARLTCGGAAALHTACQRTGLSPDAPCPLSPLVLAPPGDATVGGE